MSPRHRSGGRPRAAPSGGTWRRRAGIGAVLGCLAAALLQVGTDVDPVAPTAPSAATPAAEVQALDPAAFDSGGCVAFAPTAGDRGRTVFLDAGHGDPDPGTSGTTASGAAVDEKDITLPVALRAADGLRARGFRVALSRTEDNVGMRLTAEDTADGVLSASGKEAQLAARARCANLAGASALVSIHFDAFDDPQVRGAGTLYDPGREFGAQNTRLATVLQRRLLQSLREAGGPDDDRGIIGGAATGSADSGEDLVVLGPARPGMEPSAMPGVLVEPLFLSNPDDAALAASPEGQAALSRAVTLGVEEFLTDPRR